MLTPTCSTASSGPAGALFEGQVGAYYFLSMLTETEPRGLPGTTIDRVELQRASEDRYLDDVIVHARDINGDPAVLEIQVKRSVNFAPSDEVFRSVVMQIIGASQRTDFWSSRYELAIATSQTSKRIDGSYQEVLSWARQLGDAATFMRRINRSGSANDAMRTFVNTFRTHLQDGGAPNDDETVWGLLRRFQILIFDFTAPGSISLELVLERAAHVLEPGSDVSAQAFWSILTETTIQAAASGGDRNRLRLSEDLLGKGINIGSGISYASTRFALAEQSRMALADISDRVGQVMLTRHDRIEEVFGALENHRYVEIRGDAGVGKSGVLKQLAKQVATESQIIFFSPHRTIPRGWTAMRQTIGFQGSARELLHDFACNGGAILFIDNLDFFESEEERATVRDLVREAVNVPGFTVIATARINFGDEEPNWLPEESLTQLGVATPVIIDELNENEVDELREAAPRLAPLLTNTHPARIVSRNLFRLERLAQQDPDEPLPTTEGYMASQWWRLADGGREGRRDRARLLMALVNSEINRTGPLDATSFPSAAIDSLVNSGTLRDLGSDLVVFRHDVFREWGVANLINSDLSNIQRFDLTRPAPPALQRGVELAARMALESSTDSVSWRDLLDSLINTSFHGTWRRATLLSLVRSEVGNELLDRASDILLADQATILSELIRIVTAVEVVPATKIYESLGVDVATIPSGLNLPTGPSWQRLISWLVSNVNRLPGAVIPDVTNLFVNWSSGLLGQDPLTPTLIEILHRWLTEVELVNYNSSFGDRQVLFDGALDREKLSSLEKNLRAGFLLFCNRRPDLAREYLGSVSQLSRNDSVVEELMRFRGALAQAAPEELANLTANKLTGSSDLGEMSERRELREPFGYLDYKFIPPSPSQGPFLELLQHSPAHGLSLVRRLVDHQIAFLTEGREHGDDVFTIMFQEGPREFPWARSYNWSRGGGRGDCVTSALMALEAWAHNRIDSGDEFATVLNDVLGPPDTLTPASFLLVAVDLLLSHWPKSRDAAVPFLGCPELLSVDLERQAMEALNNVDLFGLGALHSEPKGTISRESLSSRASRRLSLDRLIGCYTAVGFEETRETLHSLLTGASERLGPAAEHSNLRDPALMAMCALNWVNPENYSEENAGDSQGKARLYISPESERLHFERLQAAAQEQFEDTNIQSEINTALVDPEKSSEELASRGVAWALEQSPTNGDDETMREHAVLAAAAILMRDGSQDLRTQHTDWAQEVFAQALQDSEDPACRIRTGLMYNPRAITFVGLTYLLENETTEENYAALLKVASHSDPSAAHGFSSVLSRLATIDQRLPSALLRCAIQASIRHRHSWDTSEELETRINDGFQQRLEASVDAELGWLFRGEVEPDWPTFPSESPRPRRHLRVARNRGYQESPESQTEAVDVYVDYSAAALWLIGAVNILNVTEHPWLINIIRNYQSWTMEVNGAGLDASEEIRSSPTEWNNAYYALLAKCMPNREYGELNALAIEPICELPDQQFYDVMTCFVKALDIIYFNDSVVDEAVAVEVRSALANRMMRSRGWGWLEADPSPSIEMHLGPAIATLFFNDYLWGQPPKCYLTQVGIERVDPFLPVLKTLAENGSSLVVATLMLNLLEVAPKPSHFQFVLSVAKAWMAVFPGSTDFWVEQQIGLRLCEWFEFVRQDLSREIEVNQQLRVDFEHLLAGMISLGVAEARTLEETLLQR